MKHPKDQFEEEKYSPVLSDQPLLYQETFIVDHLDESNISQFPIKNETSDFTGVKNSPVIREFDANLFSEQSMIPNGRTDSLMMSEDSTAHGDLAIFNRTLNNSSPKFGKKDMTHGQELAPSSFSTGDFPHPQTISLLRETNPHLKACDALTEKTPGITDQWVNHDSTPLNIASRNPVSHDFNLRGTSRNFEPLPYLQTPEQTFIDLIPMINRLTPADYCEVLVATLRQCLHQVPLKDFFMLLFRTDLNKLNISTDSENREVKFRNGGLQLCYFILETFRSPGVAMIPSVAGILNNPLLSNIKFPELRRKFLAIKIIYDFAIEVKEGPQTLFSLERYSMKLVHGIICRKLFKSSMTTLTEKDVLVGRPQLGKLIKLVYPDLTSRRFGRRGNSVYHYVGITWNPSIVNEEVLRLLEVEKERYKPNSMKMREELPMLVGTESKHIYKEKESELIDSKVHLSPSLKNTKRAKYSFVNMDSKYPANCSARLLEFVPGRPPKNSTWSKEIILKAIAALKRLNVDIEPLVQNFNIIIFSSDNLGKLYLAFAEAMAVLLTQASPEGAYLHFFLVILLLIFPICLASKEEISCANQEQIRQSLSGLISNINVYLTTFPAVISNYLLNFINIIRKMIHLSRLGRTVVKTSSVGNITNEIVRDIKRPAGNPDKLFTITTVTEELMFMSFMNATKAFKYDFFKEISRNRPKDTSASLSNLTLAFLKYGEAGSVSILLIPEFMTPDDLSQAVYDLPFQIFKILLFGLHKFWLADPLTRQLPIPVISYIARQVHKGLQEISFMNYGKRNHGLSQETFKSWWIYSTMMEEYLSVLSEIAALSERLSPEEDAK